MTESCPRTLALYKPGQAMDGIGHAFSYRGRVPNTGSLICTLCGARGCKHCGGTGKFNNYLGVAVAKCAACNGTGRAS